MGTGSSKKREETGTEFSGGYSGKPGAIEILSIGSGKSATIEGFVNTISESNEGLNEVKNGVSNAEYSFSITADAGKAKVTSVNGVPERKTGCIKPRKAWEKYGHRESRLRGREKCLVGLDNIRRTASPQLLMASRENYGRIKDASDLLRLQPSETDVFDIKPQITSLLDNEDNLLEKDITNRKIFREVSGKATKGPIDLSKCDNIHSPDRSVEGDNQARSPRRFKAGKSMDISPGRGRTGRNVSPSWLKSDQQPSTSSQNRMPEDLNDIIYDQKVRSRDNSFDRYHDKTCDGKMVSTLGPLRYGKLGMQGGAIRKELEKEGILGASSDEKKNPDVVLRELRQMGLVRQTGSSTSDSLDLEEDCQNRVTCASRLPPLEFEALCRKLEEKDKRYQEQMQKNERERQQKVNRFKERHKSAKTRRKQQEQQQPQQHQPQQQKEQQEETEAERLKLKMLDLDLM